jgi:hypothetical protein
MLSFSYKFEMLSVIMLNVIMLNVIALVLGLLPQVKLLLIVPSYYGLNLLISIQRTYLIFMHKQGINIGGKTISAASNTHCREY